MLVMMENGKKGRNRARGNWYIAKGQFTLEIGRMIKQQGLLIFNMQMGIHIMAASSMVLNKEMASM